MSSTKRRILCVDDDPDICEMLAYLLNHENYEAVTRGGVQQALELARRESFNLYILDEWFKRSSGTSLCHQLREFDPHTPIIIYSGAALEADRQEALQAGANAFVAKPDIEALLENIRRLSA